MSYGNERETLNKTHFFHICCKPLMLVLIPFHAQAAVSFFHSMHCLVSALDLLEKLLVFEHSLRISAEEALNHPYLQQYSCIEDEPIVLTPFHIEHEVCII